MTHIEAFESRDLLADGAADILAHALAARGARLFIATGGSTPGPVYDRLARRDLPWDRITVTLTDERWVDPAADESNEGLLRRRLLHDRAAAAGLMSMRGAGETLEAAADTFEGELLDALPAAAVLLGMGPDGHVASLFPGAPELAVGLDLNALRLCLAVPQARLEPYVPRLSLTASALLMTGLVILLVSGDEKRAVLDRIAADPGYAPPAATILRQTRAPVRVLWGP